MRVLDRRRATAVATARIPIACTLGGTQVRPRIDEWQAVLARASRRDQSSGCVVAMFPHDPDLTAELARLAAAEHECCPFFEFTLAVTRAGVRFEVSAPGEARDLLTLVFGPPDRAE